MKTSLWLIVLVVLLLLAVVAASAFVCVKVFDGWDALTRRGRAARRAGTGTDADRTRAHDGRP